MEDAKTLDAKMESVERRSPEIADVENIENQMKCVKLTDEMVAAEKTDSLVKDPVVGGAKIKATQMTSSIDSNKKVDKRYENTYKEGKNYGDNSRENSVYG